MRVFVTGASGWIGSAVVPELLAAGHEASGLARSGESAAKLEAAGATPVRGSLTDLDVIGGAAAAADGVIHLAFIHDFSDFAGSLAADATAVAAITEALAGSDKPLVGTGGTLGLSDGTRLASEEDGPLPGTMAEHRAANVQLVLDAAGRGVRSSVVRLPPTVHGHADHGFVSAIVAAAQAQGVSGYVGAGENRWSAVHRDDAARLYRLALESAPAGTTLHGTAEEAIPTKAIAEAIGAGLGLPTRSVAAEAAPEHFGWIGPMFGMEGAATSAVTRELLGWSPTGPTLLDDIAAGAYFEPVVAA